MAQWDRLEAEGETPRAYSSFVVYRDLGPGRSVDAAWRQEQNSSKTGARKRAPSHWWEWYEAHDWKRRAEAYDAHREREARREAEEKYRQQIADFQERQRKQAEAAGEASRLLMQKAMSRLRKVKIDEIELAQIPAYLRAAAALGQTAGNSEATALAVTDLLKALGDEPRDG